MINEAFAPAKAPRESSRWLPWEVGIVVAATTGGLVLRLYGLGARPLFGPEVYTWDFAHQTVPFIFGRLSEIETNPPFYFLLIKLVMTIGESEFLLRLPSAIAGTLAIPLVYLLGRLGGASMAGALGAGLLSLSALAIDYSRDARCYALVQDACLLAAIGLVLILNHYPRAGGARAQPAERENAGWVLLTFASITGFYLHYTFMFEIAALHAAFVIAWLGGIRFDRPFLAKWLACSLLTVIAMTWGLLLAEAQSHSDNIAWMQLPSIRWAAGLLAKVDGYSALSRFQPLPNLALVGVAAVGLAAGWRRASAVLASGAIFVLFPLLLLLVSLRQPMFIDRVLVPSDFAVCLLAGYGCLFLVRTVYERGRRWLPPGAAGYASRFFDSGVLVGLAALVLLLPAGISAANNTRGPRLREPYDQVAEYLAAAVKPGDAAAGTDGVIYYRRRINAAFPYFKLTEGNASGALVTFGAPTVDVDDLRQLALSGHSVYLALREGIELVVDGTLYPSYSRYVRGKLGHSAPPVASFGELAVYRLAGTCPASAPCTDEPQD